MQLKKPIIVANWKMHKTRKGVEEFFAYLVPEVGDVKPQVWVAPSFTTLEWAAEKVQGTKVSAKVYVGAQNIYFEEKGAFTGEVSAEQVADCGAKFVIIGHSERRRLFGETNEVVKKKIELAVTHGLIPLVCVGETLEERKGNQTNAVLKKQLTEALDAHFEGVIAYEPVWAIGTGQSATPQMVEEAHETCKTILREVCRKGHDVPVLYGGSVTADNVHGLARTKYVDGLLVGGASLEAQSFLAIIRGFAS